MDFALRLAHLRSDFSAMDRFTAFIFLYNVAIDNMNTSFEQIFDPRCSLVGVGNTKICNLPDTRKLIYSYKIAITVVIN